MGAMKIFMMGVEELIDPDLTLEENIKANIDSKVIVRGEKFSINMDDIKFAYHSIKGEEHKNALWRTDDRRFIWRR